MYIKDTLGPLGISFGSQLARIPVVYAGTAVDNSTVGIEAGIWVSWGA